MELEERFFGENKKTSFFFCSQVSYFVDNIGDKGGSSEKQGTSSPSLMAKKVKNRRLSVRSKRGKTAARTLSLMAKRMKDRRLSVRSKRGKTAARIPCLVHVDARVGGFYIVTLTVKGRKMRGIGWEAPNPGAEPTSAAKEASEAHVSEPKMKP